MGRVHGRAGTREGRLDGRRRLRPLPPLPRGRGAPPRPRRGRVPLLGLLAAGALPPGGLDFYDRLVDELCAAGVRPVPTLFHWDTPLSLRRRAAGCSGTRPSGSPITPAVVAARLGDRVSKWITLNEPAEHTLFGHALGQHAPGKQLLFDALPVAHHQLLAHGLAVRALRAAGATDIGIANSHGPTWPASQEPADLEAADFYDLLLNRLFADPLLLGQYPEGSGRVDAAATSSPT